MAFDFEHAVSAPFRMQPGLRRLPPGATQTTPNRPGSRHQREKLAVLMSWPDEALLTLPDFDAKPALRALLSQAALEHPDALQWSPGTERLHARWLGWSADWAGDVRDEGSPLPELGLCLARLAPEWRLPALLALSLEEDLAVVDGRTATLPWLAVALPSHWAPPEKIGKHFREVHAPVADNTVLLAAGEHLMRLATGAERWERFVWNITYHPRLNHHPRALDPAGWAADLRAADVPAQAWFRTERQTFIPVAGHSQAVFTIQVQVQPLAEALAHADQARALHDALASMSPAVLAYRELDRPRDALLAWLDARATHAD